MDYDTLVSLMNQAIAGNETLLLTYGDANYSPTRSEIRPHGLGGAYLSAYCYLRQRSRVFRVDRIVAREPTPYFETSRGKASAGKMQSAKQ